MSNNSEWQLGFLRQNLISSRMLSSHVVAIIQIKDVEEGAFIVTKPLRDLGLPANSH